MRHRQGDPGPFPISQACSPFDPTQDRFEKGFHGPANQTELKALLDQVTLAKKGRLSLTGTERETGDAFVAARKAHAAVESGINALEVHGLDVCPDHGIDGFQTLCGFIRPIAKYSKNRSAQA